MQMCVRIRGAKVATGRSAGHCGGRAVITALDGARGGERAGPVPTGPVPTGPVSAGPVPAGPVSSGSARGDPVPAGIGRRHAGSPQLARRLSPRRDSGNSGTSCLLKSGPSCPGPHSETRRKDCSGGSVALPISVRQAALGGQRPLGPALALIAPVESCVVSQSANVSDPRMSACSAVSAPVRSARPSLPGIGTGTDTARWPVIRFQVLASAAAVVTCGPATWIRPRPGSPPATSATTSATSAAATVWNRMSGTGRTRQRPAARAPQRPARGTGSPGRCSTARALARSRAPARPSSGSSRSGRVRSRQSRCRHGGVRQRAARRRGAGRSPGPGPAPRAWVMTRCWRRQPLRSRPAPR